MTAPATRPWRRFERRVTGRFTVSRRAPLLQVLKAATAAIITWFICLWIFPEQVPIFGAIAALLSVQESVDQSLTRGIERVVGVLLGVSVALGAGVLLGPQSWLFLAAIIVSMALGWLLRMTNSSTNQIAISALLMIALGGLSFDYGVERLVETAIGAAIGITINALVVAPVRTTPVHLAIGDLLRLTAQAMRRLAEALEEPRDREWIARMMHDARQLQGERDAVHQLLRSARESLRLNPRGPRYRAILGEDDELFARLQPIVTQVIGMTRALSDHYGADLVRVPEVHGIAVELRRAAHDLERLSRPDSPTPVVVEPPALTAPYVISRPDPEYWQLIGSLMEDLRRVRGRITGELT